MLKQNPLCNKCGLEPKYPSQGLCKKCYFEKQSAKYQAKQRARALAYPTIVNLEGEIWKDIQNADGYMVSNFGRIKSLNYRDQQREWLIKLRKSRMDGYLKADLDKYNYRPSVHRLVAEHFIPNPDGLPMVLHGDENKQNNHVSNLRWGTRSENALDYISYTNKNGIKRSKKCKENVLAIFNSKESVQSISILFSVSPASVWAIKTGRSWSSVTGMKCTDKRKKA